LEGRTQRYLISQRKLKRHQSQIAAAVGMQADKVFSYDSSSNVSKKKVQAVLSE
jgi:hypothetical protein